LLPLGKGHVITDALGSPAENIGVVAAEHFDRDELVLRHGGDGPVSQLVGGFFSFEGSPLSAVMSALPPLIHIPRGEAGAPPWLAAISRFLVAEAQQPNPGSSLMISRLIDLLVIRTLRSWAASEANRMGWLGGLGEERIGRVLSAMHADPFRRWTVQSLAEIARMSRSIFAERFTAAVGEPPLRYLSRWRLTIAADLLRSGGLKVTEAAYQSGYASDAAFSRAFKAHFGYAPSEARSHQSS
jgi:AraC-like DNA-binding protein